MIDIRPHRDAELAITGKKQNHTNRACGNCDGGNARSALRQPKGNATHQER